MKISHALPILTIMIGFLPNAANAEQSGNGKISYLPNALSSFQAIENNLKQRVTGFKSVVDQPRCYLLATIISISETANTHQTWQVYLHLSKHSRVCILFWAMEVQTLSKIIQALTKLKILQSINLVGLR